MKDENSKTDIIDILDNYSSLVAAKGDGEPNATTCWGDGLSQISMDKAKERRQNSLDSWSRLEAMQSAAADWHLRLLLLIVSNTVVTPRNKYFYV